MGAAPNPLRVAVVLPYLAQGGTESQVLGLVRRIDRGRFDPFIVALGGGGGLELEYRALDVPVAVLGYTGISPIRGRGWRTIGDSLRCVRRLAALLREEKAGIVHAWLPAANFLGPLAARIAGVSRIIISKRTLSDYKARHRFTASAESIGNRLADVILVNSDAVRRDVERTERNWEGKFRKIYNGVAPIDPWTPEETRAFRRREGIPADALVALCVSNFYPYKGHEELVESRCQGRAGVPERHLPDGRKGFGDDGGNESACPETGDRGIGPLRRQPDGRAGPPPGLGSLRPPFPRGGVLQRDPRGDGGGASRSGVRRRRKSGGGRRRGDGAAGAIPECGGACLRG